MAVLICTKLGYLYVIFLGTPAIFYLANFNFNLS